MGGLLANYKNYNSEYALNSDKPYEFVHHIWDKYSEF